MLERLIRSRFNSQLTKNAVYPICDLSCRGNSSPSPAKKNYRVILLYLLQIQVTLGYDFFDIFSQVWYIHWAGERMVQYTCIIVHTLLWFPQGVLTSIVRKKFVHSLCLITYRGTPCTFKLGLNFVSLASSRGAYDMSLRRCFWWNWRQNIISAMVRTYCMNLPMAKLNFHYRR